MEDEFKTGSLGKLYGSILKAPFKIANLPFKAHRQYYGKPKPEETYTGTIIQKQRLKKILKLMNSGKNLPNNDRFFLDMVNDFITGEGINPFDQSKIQMNCDTGKKCKPYIYKKSSRTVSSGKEEIRNKTGKKEESKTDFNLPKIIFIKFLEDLKPNKGKTFKNMGSYDVKVLDVKKDYYGIQIMVQNSFLDEGDYLIFKTPVKNIIGQPLKYRVFQNNTKKPMKQDIDLGSVSAKIFLK